MNEFVGFQKNFSLNQVEGLNHLDDFVLLNITSFVPFYAWEYDKGELYRAISMVLDRKNKQPRYKVSTKNKFWFIKYLKRCDLDVINELREIRAEEKWRGFSSYDLKDAVSKAVQAKAKPGNLVSLSHDAFYKIHRSQSRAMLIYEIESLAKYMDLDIGTQLRVKSP